MISARRFRDAIGSFPTGVAVVTAAGPAGLTTNAVTSLSLDPVLLLVCFDNGSRTLPAVRESRRFAVNVLRSDQEELARVFASKRVAQEKFAAVTHELVDGAPVLEGVLAWFVCELRQLVPGGDHTIGIGAVEQLGHDPDGEPLVFFRGRYSAAPASGHRPR
ncbi:MAG TPA: flavin reductase family protein [Solirubrobacteraceae bacterium]|nr:flavin reductase family protein [Solirubrobacteraceae bacterium]